MDPKILTKLLNQSVDYLDLSPRPRNCLIKYNIKTIGDLLKYTESDLLRMKQFNEKSVEEIKEKLMLYGLTLKAPKRLN